MLNNFKAQLLALTDT